MNGKRVGVCWEANVMSRVYRAKLANIWCLIGACAVASGCGSEAHSGEAGDPGAIDPVRETPPSETGLGAGAAAPDPSGQKHTLCGAVRIGDDLEPETYSFPLMNGKLADYPEFRAAIGMNGVSSCDEARSFMKAYNEYLETHPRFDDDSPSKEVLARQWIAEGVVDPPQKVEKIFAGIPNDDEDVVRIARITLPAEGLNGASYACSASRLAGPLFLTAAHCLPNVVTTNPVKNMEIWIKRVRPDGTVGYYGGGVTAATAPPFVADGMRLSGYLGTGDRARDIAVVHIRPATQKLLENDTATWASGLLLSSRSPVPNDTEDLFGWGLSTDTELPQNTILRVPDHVVKIETVQSTWFSVPNKEVSSTGSVKVCVGDSGGPARLSSTGSINGVLATRSDPDGMSRDAGCAPFDSVQNWTRVDVYINDIRQWVTKLQGGYRNPPYECRYHSTAADLDPENINSHWDCRGKKAAAP